MLHNEKDHYGESLHTAKKIRDPGRQGRRMSRSWSTQLQNVAIPVRAHGAARGESFQNGAILGLKSQKCRL